MPSMPWHSVLYGINQICCALKLFDIVLRNREELKNANEDVEGRGDRCFQLSVFSSIYQ